MKWVSGWVIVGLRQFSILSAISLREQVHCQWDNDDDDVRRTNRLSWNFIVLPHWNNSPRVDMSLHTDTLFWFRANQSLLLLLNEACLAEKQHTNFIVFGLARPGLEPTMYRPRGEHANNCVTDGVMKPCFVQDYIRKSFKIPKG